VASGINAIKDDIQSAFHTKKDASIGTLGILHPSVLEKFEIGYPCSALEFNLEPFQKEIKTIWTE
jgi:phenylalanyl-tRNA synthetase beta chain